MTKPDHSAWTVVLIGVGAIGTPLALYLLNLGFRCFVLFDPKCHKEANVITQCSPSEVGRLKVKAAARRLRRAGAAIVLAWPSFVELVEPGWAGPQTIIVVCGDRLAAVRAAHDLARALRRPLFRINIEASCTVAALSAFDYRGASIERCALCSWSSREFAAQETVTSCAPSTERPTGSPRALSALAAGWGALTIARAMVGGSEATGIWNQSLVFSPDGPTFLESRLPANPHCPGGHSLGSDLVWLPERPAELSLDLLARRAGFDPAEVTVRGSGSLTLAGRCAACRREHRGRWWRRGNGPVGRCACGGAVHASPFWTLESFARSEVGEHWTRPLSELRVGRRALLELAAEDREVRYVVG